MNIKVTNKQHRHNWEPLKGSTNFDLCAALMHFKSEGTSKYCASHLLLNWISVFKRSYLRICFILIMYWVLQWIWLYLFKHLNLNRVEIQYWKRTQEIGIQDGYSLFVGRMEWNSFHWTLGENNNKFDRKNYAFPMGLTCITIRRMAR